MLRAGLVDPELAEIMLETFHFLQEEGAINFGVPASAGEGACMPCTLSAEGDVRVQHCVPVPPALLPWRYRVKDSPWVSKAK